MFFCKTIEAETGMKVVKEYAFHPTRKWRFDYCIPEAMIAIEVEGGAYTQGRHTRGKGFIADMDKYNEAAILGWCLIRVTPDKLMTSKTIDMIKKALDKRVIDEYLK